LWWGWGGVGRKFSESLTKNKLTYKHGRKEKNLSTIVGPWIFLYMYNSFLDAGVGFICGSATCPKITSNTFHCILMSIGLFIEDARGLVNQNIFREVQLYCKRSDKKENQIFLIYKEVQNGAVAK
jgi:hypothetical protein